MTRGRTSLSIQNLLNDCTVTPTTTPTSPTNNNNNNNNNTTTSKSTSSCTTEVKKKHNNDGKNDSGEIIIATRKAIVKKKKKLLGNSEDNESNDSIPNRRKKNNDAVRRFRERTKRKKLELKEAYEKNEQRIEHLTSLLTRLSDELAGRTVNPKELLDSSVLDRSCNKNFTHYPQLAHAKQHSIDVSTDTSI